jgi:hypothetical protein
MPQPVARNTSRDAGPTSNATNNRPTGPNQVLDRRMAAPTDGITGSIQPEI